MSLVPYNGPAGQFNYDDKQFTVSTETGLLVYIGSEIYGQNINIPQGILSCEGMFKNSIIVTPPRIPRGVVNAEEMFEGCRQLKKYPLIPGSVVFKRDMMSKTTFDPVRNQVGDDMTLDYIDQSMNQHIDDIMNNWQSEIVAIEEAFSEEDISLEQKELIDAELRARLSINEARLEALTREQNHLNGIVKSYIDRSFAPVDFMEDGMRIKALQISQVREEIDSLKEELRYRNPTVFDIMKTSAIDAKENLLHIGQQSMDTLVEKVKGMTVIGAKAIGNVFRAAELSMAKIDMKIMQVNHAIDTHSIERTQKFYNTILPGICGASAKINNIKESLKGFVALLNDKDFEKKAGLTPVGKKLVESMYANMSKKLENHAKTEAEIEHLRIRIDDTVHNLSPKERQTAVELTQNLSERLREINQSARSASQEKIASYEKVKEVKERGNVGDLEKEMNAKDIADRYPISVSSINPVYSWYPFSKDDVDQEKPSFQMPQGAYLFNEVDHEKKIYTETEKNEMIEKTLTNIKGYSRVDNLENPVYSRTETSVHIKEDHAEVLKSEIPDKYKDVDEDRIMGSEKGQNAIMRSSEKWTKTNDAPVKDTEEIGKE